MSYSIDANLLVYASNSAAPQYRAASRFLAGRAGDPDLLCLTWPVLMAYQRIVTHPSVFANPLPPEQAWGNISALLELPRSRVITEEPGFEDAYGELTGRLTIRGNLVPDAHIAVILRQHGVTRLYSADSDFRKFEFLEVVNPLA